MKQFFIQNWLIVVLLASWILPWKGYALWRAAQRNEKWWFIVFLLVNTLAILEIVYIFVITRKKPSTVA